MKYRELKERQQQEINAFPFIWAFNESQFADGMRRLGLDPTADRGQIVHYAGAAISERATKKPLKIYLQSTGTNCRKL